MTGFARSLVARLAARRDLSRGSLLHCHARGLHSIVLREDPFVRLFVTDDDHELWRIDCPDGHAIPAAIAFHPHHCALRLEAVRGMFVNVSSLPGARLGRDVTLRAFEFSSKIGGGDGRFRLAPIARHTELRWAEVPAGSFVDMQAAEIHSVHVARGERAAWLVTEGAENPNYVPRAYSHLDLTEFTPTGLYEPMPADRARELVDWAVAP